MPGMMDTVLNLGLNDESVEGLSRQTGDERFAFDSYRRFIQMSTHVVLGLPGEESKNSSPLHANVLSQAPTQRYRPQNSANSSPSSKSLLNTTSVRHFQRHPRNSFAAQSKPSSHPGMAAGQSPIAIANKTTTISVPRSTSRRWSLAIGMTIQWPPIKRCRRVERVAST